MKKSLYLSSLVAVISFFLFLGVGEAYPKSCLNCHKNKKNLQAMIQKTKAQKAEEFLKFLREKSAKKTIHAQLSDQEIKRAYNLFAKKQGKKESKEKSALKKTGKKDKLNQAQAKKVSKKKIAKPKEKAKKTRLQVMGSKNLLKGSSPDKLDKQVPQALPSSQGGSAKSQTPVVPAMSTNTTLSTPSNSTKAPMQPIPVQAKPATQAPPSQAPAKPIPSQPAPQTPALTPSTPTKPVVPAVPAVPPKMEKPKKKIEGC